LVSPPTSLLPQPFEAWQGNSRRLGPSVSFLNPRQECILILGPTQTSPNVVHLGHRAKDAPSQKVRQLLFLAPSLPLGGKGEGDGCHGSPPHLHPRRRPVWRDCTASATLPPEGRGECSLGCRTACCGIVGALRYFGPRSEPYWGYGKDFLPQKSGFA